MEQKRFLTADEVFQMFGVDAHALERLVDSGAVKALADLGSFKYRTDDFVALVDSGTITPRTSAELFQLGSAGEISTFSLKSDLNDVPSDDGVSYIDLDEAALEQAISDSDSDVRIVGIAAEDRSVEIPVVTDDPREWEGVTETLDLSASGNRKPDSDSDVRLAPLGSEPIESGELKTATDHDLNPVALSDESGLLMIASPSGSDVNLVSLDANVNEGEVSRQFDAAHSTNEFTIAPNSESVIEADSGIRLSDAENEIRLTNDDSGITLVGADSGISLADEGAADDSGITLVGADSGISLAGHDHAGDDSGIRLVGEASSGDDSGISLVDADSGISLIGNDDSGIRLSDVDSGISLVGADSGITAEGDVFDSKPGRGRKQIENPVKGNDTTQTLDLSDELFNDSGFDVDLAEEDKTSVMKAPLGTTPGYPKTVVDKGGKSPSTPPVLSLSESFKLDEPPEVEDLEISDDLEGADASDFSDEFAAVEEEEVFEASDDDFSAAELSVAEDEEDLSDGEVMVPAAKVKKGPREPEWGAVAVAPIAVSALMMLAAVTVLWGGVATMWTGGEAPGPVGALISTLAGLSPF